MDVKNFFEKITSLYEELRGEEGGKVATYIPQLGKVDPALFSISVHTMDNQTLFLGDSKYRYCIQSCSKPLTYMLALQENGAEKVRKHINTEPSGKQFNALEFDDDNLPHNGMINAGAIMATSLVKKGYPGDERYAYILNTWKKMLGTTKVGFDNEVYMGERRTADDNYSLAYKMRGNGVFPEGTDLENTLQLYFQTCSITMNTESMALFAAILANGGISPKSGRQYFTNDIIKNVLCVLSTSGMYDYSGRWFSEVGVPAKSGVSGCIFAVIPNVCGICVFSPRLDKYGNSVRGVKFFNRLAKMFRMHIYDNSIVGNNMSKQIDTNLNKLLQLEIYECCQKGDHIRLKQLLKNDKSTVHFSDYDKRTPLHIAVDNGSIECINNLMDFGADYRVKDRWGKSPFKYAIDGGSKEIVMSIIVKIFERNSGIMKMKRFFQK
jgi:glutaminase